uniref:Phospholipase/carboxylesterase/thioesterase domain-containing protein n=1 Tax=Auxenochlorella protothecoides TaxID=3075 RepID=A0A1D1ZUA0_AUXPR
MLEYGPTIVHESREQHTATVILLHGLTGSAEDWVQRLPEFEVPHIKLIAPNAPLRPITLDLGEGSGKTYRGWYDLDGVGAAKFREAMDGKEFDPEGLREAEAYLRGLIDDEVAAGIPEHRIALVGFSQAGRLVLKTFATYKPTLAGVAGLSTWLAPQDLEATPAALARPIFLAHGDADDLVPYATGEETRDVLLRAGAKDLEFKTYPGLAHERCTEEMHDLRAFLLRALPV